LRARVSLSRKAWRSPLDTRYLAHRHASGRHGDDLVVKTSEAALVFANDWYRKNELTDYEGYYASVFYCYLAARCSRSRHKAMPTSRSRGEPIHLIGVEFSKASRNIVGFEVETLYIK